MADKLAEYLISIGGDGTDLRNIFAGLKSQLRRDAADLEALTSKIELFKGVEDRAAAASDAFFKARDAADAYRQEIARIEASGGKVGDDLIKGLAASEKAAASANREFTRQSDALAKLDATLKRAGVDTNDLAAEQLRLANASKAATAAATEQEARQALGLKTLKDVTPEINRINAAYNTLRASGTLSVKEVALAQEQLKTRTAELRAQITGAGAAAKTGGADLLAFFSAPLTAAVGLAGGIAGVTLALANTITVANDFKNGLTQIGSITNATREELAGLGDGAKAVAQEVGVDVNEALRGLFDLIRSGVPRENALEVLKVAAEAAKAGLSDLGTGVKAANLLLDSFGADVADLPALFDKLIVGAHNGGATLKEFADNGGALLNVARAAGVSFDDLLAVLTVLVDKSGNAEKSIGDLTKIIAKLDTADARNKLRELGITGDSLVDIFQQLGARGLSLGEVLGIDLTGAGVKSAASIAALTKNAKELPDALEKIEGAAGGAAKSLEQLKDSPKEIGERFSAELSIAGNAIGNFLSGGGKLKALGVDILHEFNQIPAAFEAAGHAFDDSGGSIKETAKAFLQLDPAAANAARALKATASAATEAGNATKIAADQAKRAKDSLTDFSAKLLADVQALATAAQRDIADANTRAEAQIAALDRSKAAEADTAAATLEIQLDAAAKRLAIIQKSERDITAAVDAQTAAREKLARDAGEVEKKIAGDSATVRIQALGGVLQQYQQHYAALIAIAQNASAKFQAAEQARVDIARSVSAALRAIALEDLSGLDAFLEKQKHIDELISEGRQKAIQGDIAAAKQFFDQAIAESNGLTKVIDDNGVEVVSALQARSAKLEALKKIADAANESIGDQGDAAKAGADKAIAAANEVGDKIKDLQSQYDRLKETAAEGLAMKVEVDEASVESARAILDDLTKPRTVDVTVNIHTVGGGGPGGGGEPPPEVQAPTFNRGGLVRRFAAGGSGFWASGWQKVPGIGSSDTVPALLNAGSFVVRKSSSERYGDGLMSALANVGSIPRFAVGGIAQAILSPVLRQAIEGIVLGGDAASDKYADTLAKLGQIVETARPLPRGAPGHSFGIPVAEWAATILAKWQGFPDERKKAVDDAIQSDFASIMSSIEEGLRQHVEVNVAFTLAALALRKGTLSSLLRRAVGGDVGSDTVPALLTPGEWVIPKAAVAKLGTGFLSAINSARMAPATLGAALGSFAPPMPRFAAGGLVPGAAMPVGASSAGRAPITVNVYASGADLRDESTVRRKFLPVLREIERRSK